MYTIEISQLSLGGSLVSDGLFEKRRIALDLSRQTHVDVTITNDDDEATENVRVDDGCQLESLSLLQQSS